MKMCLPNSTDISSIMNSNAVVLTIVLDKCVWVPNSNTIKINLKFMYICVRGKDFAPVSTILPLDITAVLTMLYI